MKVGRFLIRWRKFAGGYGGKLAIRDTKTGWKLDFRMPTRDRAEYVDYPPRWHCPTRLKVNKREGAGPWVTQWALEAVVLGFGIAIHRNVELATGKAS